jgi:NAD(P)H-dependent FMN reductase
MLKVAVIIGSTRPGRVGESVAKWTYELAKNRTDAEFELVDIKDGYVFVTPEYNHGI